MMTHIASANRSFACSLLCALATSASAAPYEEGLCVPRNWDKAAGLYMLAEEAGNGSAIARLIAGYAIAGRDNGLALWWAAKRWGTGSFATRCLPTSDPDANPDGFNNELERMSPALLQGCVYMAGVVDFDIRN